MQKSSERTEVILMVRWIKIYKDTWFGFYGLGILFFLMQEIPYVIMPFIKIASNPLMDMADAYPALNIIEKILGISMILSMIFIINSKTKWFSISSIKEKLYFSTAIIFLIGYYIGWVLYFNGHQSLLLVLIMLVSFPSLYYTFIGLWRKNIALLIFGIVFLFVHLMNLWSSY